MATTLYGTRASTDTITSNLGAIGYATGAGAAVTQATSKTTAVTINTVCGAITTYNTSMTPGSSAVFTVTNSSVAVRDVIVLSLASGNTAGIYTVGVDAVAAGSFVISIRNNGSGYPAEALVINFAVIKAVNS
jgi:hypothetical protein